MIGLMDCNNFFVSCERLFRPDLIKKPVAVLSANDGCIVARSQEVKDLGVPMGAPFFEIKDLCEKEGVTIFSSNFTLYRDLSARVMAALREECGSIVVYSIDEAFFELESEVDIEALTLMRARITQKTGIPVSFGVASTKTLAKIANAEAKRGTGVSFLTDDRLQDIAHTVSCGSVWGIGRETAAKLATFNIKTVADLLLQGLGFMRQHFGVHGERLFFELSGIAAYTDDTEDAVHASISSTRSFAQIVRKRSVLESALGHHVAHVAEKLRERGVVASRLSIVAAPSRHGSYALRQGTAMRDLLVPTNDTTILLKESLSLLGTLYDAEIPYKKAGVTVSGIIPETYVSGNLFETPSKESGGGMYQTVDLINSRFGQGTIRPALTLGASAWQESKKRKSPEYTTQWAHIARVKAI